MTRTCCLPLRAVLSVLHSTVSAGGASDRPHSGTGAFYFLFSPPSQRRSDEETEPEFDHKIVSGRVGISSWICRLGDPGYPSLERWVEAIYPSCEHDAIEFCLLFHVGKSAWYRSLLPCQVMSEVCRACSCVLLMEAHFRIRTGNLCVLCACLYILRL
jgi:hypothetical protein